MPRAKAFTAKACVAKPRDKACEAKAKAKAKSKDQGKHVQGQIMGTTTKGRQAGPRRRPSFSVGFERAYPYRVIIFSKFA